MFALWSPSNQTSLKSRGLIKKNEPLKTRLPYGTSRDPLVNEEPCRALNTVGRRYLENLSFVLWQEWHVLVFVQKYNGSKDFLLPSIGFHRYIFKHCWLHKCTFAASTCEELSTFLNCLLHPILDTLGSRLRDHWPKVCILLKRIAHLELLHSSEKSVLNLSNPWSAINRNPISCHQTSDFQHQQSGTFGKRGLCL